MLILASPSEAAFLHGRLVLVIDDLHHADQPSLLLLRFLAVAGRPTAAVTPPTETATADACIFRREGDFWTIAYEGQLIRLRDTRGLRYLALLLAQPGREFHAADLVTAETASTAPPGHDGEMVVASGLGDAGALLDARARADYRRRLADLREELEEAERMHDLGRAARARAELEVLAAQLASAARGKRAASHAERARLAVTKGIKSALEKIAASHPALGRHLAATVRRGYFCVYVPDPRRPITWVG